MNYVDFMGLLFMCMCACVCVYLSYVWGKEFVLIIVWVLKKKVLGIGYLVLFLL